MLVLKGGLTHLGVLCARVLFFWIFWAGVNQGSVEAG